MKSILLLFISFSISLITFGQENDGLINGRITEKGGALIGVAAMIEGTSIGTFTDIDGNFKLDPANIEEGKITIKFTCFKLINKCLLCIKNNCFSFNDMVF